MKGFVVFCAATFLAAVSVQLVFCSHSIVEDNPGELKLNGSEKAFTADEKNELFELGLGIFSPEQLGSVDGRKNAQNILKQIDPNHFYDIVHMLTFDLLKHSYLDFNHFIKIMKDAILIFNLELNNIDVAVPSSSGLHRPPGMEDLMSQNTLTPEISKERAEKYIIKIAEHFFEQPEYFINEFNQWFSTKIGNNGYLKSTVDFEIGALMRYILDQITFSPDDEILTIEILADMVYGYSMLRNDYCEFYSYWYFWLVIGGDDYDNKEKFLEFFIVFSQLQPSPEAWKPMAAMTRDFCANTQIDLADLFKPSVQIICENEVHDASKFIGEIDYRFSKNIWHPILNFKLDAFFDEKSGSAISSKDSEKKSEKSE